MKRVLLASFLLSLLLPGAGWCQPPALLAIWGSTGDQPGQFNRPTGLALGPDGNLYVADYDNRRIQVLTSGGAFVTQWGCDEHESWSLSAPMHVAVDAGGRVFVTEFLLSSSSQSGLQVFSSTGVYLAS